MATLPNEILDTVLAHLTCPDLASASLVGRFWQALAFPHLYKSVYFNIGDHLDHFCERVASDDGSGPVSICATVKGLVLYHKYGLAHVHEIISEPNLKRLNVVIPRLTRLRHLSWELYFLPEDTRVLRSLQTQCSKLESVHLWFGQDYDYYYSPQYALLFQFNGLTHLSITSGDSPGIFDESCRHALTSLLASCPNLVCVKFDLPTTNDSYSPNPLIDSLGEQFTFPDLRTLRFRGSVDPNWAAFFSYSDLDLHPLRSFLTRHPQIENLGLGSYIGARLPKKADPNDMPLFFPGIKCFEGPGFLCCAIAQSSLAEQMESLIIADKVVYSQGDILMDMNLGVGALPRLRRLGIWAEYPISGLEARMRLEVKMIKTLVEAASALEELEVRAGVDDHVEFLDLIQRAPNLRKITIHEETLDALDEVGETRAGLEIWYWRWWA